MTENSASYGRDDLREQELQECQQALQEVRRKIRRVIGKRITPDFVNVLHVLMFREDVLLMRRHDLLAPQGEICRFPLVAESESERAARAGAPRCAPDAMEEQ